MHECHETPVTVNFFFSKTPRPDLAINFADFGSEVTCSLAKLRAAALRLRFLIARNYGHVIVTGDITTNGTSDSAF